jgi:hypothetical protein
MSFSTRPPYGATALGKPTGAASPTVFYGQDSAGHHWALWFGTDGVLRTASSATVEAPGFNWNTGGAPVLRGLTEEQKDDIPQIETGLPEGTKGAGVTGPKVVPPPPLPTSKKTEKSA